MEVKDWATLLGLISLLGGVLYGALRLKLKEDFDRRYLKEDEFEREKRSLRDEIEHKDQLNNQALAQVTRDVSEIKTNVNRLIDMTLKK